MSNEDNLLETLMHEDDITWQSMIFELVKTEQMDPWDVNLGDLSEKFISMINEMQETNLKIGGKVILASAILLRLKSGRFIDTDLAQLEALISSMNEEEYDDFEEGDLQTTLYEKDRRNYKIYPRTPQPRKRKVSVYDLVHALEGVIEKQKIKIKRKVPDAPVEVKLQSRDINLVIKDVFDKLNLEHANTQEEQFKFSTLLPSTSRDDIVSTFIPLLHLTNQRVTDLHQKEAFDDFDVHLLKKGLQFEDLEKTVDD